jgi:ADP-dependent NAD(P)H-hydrate dehydratase
MYPSHPGRSEAVVVDDTVLRRLPLPELGSETSKNERGSVLIVGGSRETPGGVMLAGEAALRAGAGRLQLATVASVCAPLSVAVPEARVIELPETAAGAVAPAAAETLRSQVGACDVVVIGPGAMDPDPTGSLLRQLLPDVPAGVTVVIDAAAIPVLHEHPELILDFAGDAVVVPNPSEMATLLGRDEEAVRKDPETALADALDLVSAAVALRGGQTWMSAPGQPTYVDDFGLPALATAGSGDVAVGALAGVLARGASPLRAMIWAVHAHATAGRILAGSTSGLGLVARDLVDQLRPAFNSLECV